MVSIQILSDVNFPEINCSNEAYPVGDPRRSIYVLTADESATISARVNEFNNALRTRAEANGSIYVDATAVLRRQQQPPGCKSDPEVPDASGCAADRQSGYDWCCDHEYVPQPCSSHRGLIVDFV